MEETEKEEETEEESEEEEEMNSTFLASQSTVQVSKIFCFLDHI